VVADNYRPVSHNGNKQEGGAGFPARTGKSPMRTYKNVTVAVSEAAWRRGRVWAARHDTTISALVQYLLERLSDQAPLKRKYPDQDAGPDATSAPQKSPSRASNAA
jgi:hypothetical protein